MSTLLSQEPDEGDGVEAINAELTVSRPPDTCPNRGVVSNWLGIRGERLRDFGVAVIDVDESQNAVRRRSGRGLANLT